MPLPKSNIERLSPDEIMLFKMWIKQGAQYEKHWAFETPKKAVKPKLKTRKKKAAGKKED